MANEAEAKVIAPRFQLKAVELHELLVHKPVQGSLPSTTFNFEINIESNVDSNQKLVINATKVKIKGDDPNIVLGSIICACIFSVENFEEVIMMNNDKQAELNESFAYALNSICISTTRGVMFSEFKGTILHYAILPVIDIKSLSMMSALAK